VSVIYCSDLYFNFASAPSVGEVVRAEGGVEDLNRRDHAPMHNGVLEGECCRVIALLGFRTVLFAFSDRFCLLPWHMPVLPHTEPARLDSASTIRLRCFQREGTAIQWRDDGCGL